MSASSAADESTDSLDAQPEKPSAPRRTFARFLLVGCANASIDAGVYVVLRALGLELFLANLISTTCGLIFSFFANRTFTFDARTTTKRGLIWQAVNFFGVVGFGLWVIQPLVILGAVAVLEARFDFPTVVVDLVAKVAAIGVALVWNYALFRVLVFRDRPASQAAPRA